MRILIDITHPAHVHFFRHTIQKWQHEEHTVLITSRAKDMTQELLTQFGLEHVPIGLAKPGIVSLGLELAHRAIHLRRIARDFQPDVATAVAGTFLVYGMLTSQIPCVVFYDTEHARISNAITYPLATAVVTPRAYSRSIGAKQIRYNGFQELAYTHPSVFTPDPAVLEKEGLRMDESFSIVRLVNWSASHDFADHGVTNLDEVVSRLEQFGRVLISSEKALPDRFRVFQLKGPRTNMLHLQAFAHLMFGESATMASECAMLGTPAIFLSTSRRGYIDELESRYNLVFGFYDRQDGQRLALQKAERLLADPKIPSLWKQRRVDMLAELIDVAEFARATVLRFARSCR